MLAVASAPMMKSRVLVVVIEVLAAVPVPVAVAGLGKLGSKGEAVFTPLTPKITATELLPPPVRLMVRLSEPLDDHVEYHVSSTPAEKDRVALWVQVRLGVEDMALTLTPAVSATET